MISLAQFNPLATLRIPEKSRNVCYLSSDYFMILAEMIRPEEDFISILYRPSASFVTSQRPQAKCNINLQFLKPLKTDVIF